MPVLVREPTLAPAPIRMPVALWVCLPEATAWMAPVLTMAGAVTPEPIHRPVALASTAVEDTPPSLRTPPTTLTTLLQSMCEIMSCTLSWLTP